VLDLSRLFPLVVDQLHLISRTHAAISPAMRLHLSRASILRYALRFFRPETMAWVLTISIRLTEVAVFDPAELSQP
jgi:hypothetical protein